ncbi:MAG: hypothetical protein GY811_11715 [Myxococcales bacterium]|nr:hypothetical protein [Myxococcales bacterium]
MLLFHVCIAEDPLLATLVCKKDPTGQSRRQSRGQPLASSSTFGRIEWAKDHANSSSRYEKVVADFDKVEEVFLDVFIESYAGRVPERIDLDPSVVPLHGGQEERFFHGYHRQARGRGRRGRAAGPRTIASPVAERVGDEAPTPVGMSRSSSARPRIFSPSVSEIPGSTSTNSPEPSMA